MSINDENWRPPKSIDFEGKYRQCSKIEMNMTAQGCVSDRCPDEAVWWHPKLPASLCEEHVSKFTKNIIKVTWAFDRYGLVLEALIQKGCKLNVDL